MGTQPVPVSIALDNSSVEDQSPDSNESQNEETEEK